MKILSLLCALCVLCGPGCASSNKLETPEGTYRWQRGGATWQPGKWVLETPVDASALNSQLGGADAAAVK